MQHVKEMERNLTLAWAKPGSQTYTGRIRSFKPDHVEGFDFTWKAAGSTGEKKRGRIPDIFWDTQIALYTHP